jgi:hypothetical protein
MTREMRINSTDFPPAAADDHQDEDECRLA